MKRHADTEDVLPCRERAPRLSHVHAPRFVECRECGESFARKTAKQIFCSVVCREGFQNRRKYRGAKFYDLIMALRFDRGRAKAAGVWTLISRMASNFAEEDERKREGWKSWESIYTVSKRNLRHVATRHRV